jgi:hypothetical protein
MVSVLIMELRKVMMMMLMMMSSKRKIKGLGKEGD